MTTNRPNLVPAGSAGLVLAVALAVAMLGCDGEAPAPPPSPDRPRRLPTATIRVGRSPLVVEIADDDAERRKGMMFRERLADDEAMLFVFDREANLRFWMKNTPVDLDLAYIAADGTITQVERMKAHVLDPVYSREPVRFALEVPAGWFERHGIGVGTNVAIPANVGRAEEKVPGTFLPKRASCCQERGKRKKVPVTFLQARAAEAQRPTIATSTWTALTEEPSWQRAKRTRAGRAGRQRNRSVPGC